MIFKSTSILEKYVLLFQNTVIKNISKISMVGENNKLKATEQSSNKH